jgi:hypothetical protein
MLFALRPKLLILAILIASANQLNAQKDYPKDYFRAPLDAKLMLAGTFGEIRSNHFHSGIDIKTGGVEGYPVYAVADGFVSRIKVSAYGFGKAMYITHPNGYVSVYGHLSKYNKTVGDYVRKEQYRRENFEIELFPAATEFPVKKGDIIAYSGNSGSSGGPHLHFEIRDGATEKPINPLLFGYNVTDLVKPTISSIKIYPEDKSAKINGSNKAARFMAEGSGTGYRLAENPVVRVSGNISFAIQAIDKQSDTDNKNGIYSVKLFVDSKEVAGHRMETFAFDKTRYVNSLIDYEEYVRNDVRLQRTKIDPGNQLDIYNETVNKGVVLFNDTLTHVIKYEVTDAAGNMSILTFKLKADRVKVILETSSEIENKPSNIKKFNYATPNNFRSSSVSLDAPKGVFYDSFTFKYDSAKQIAGTFSIVHKIHNKYTPVHDYLTLSIKAIKLTENLTPKALIVKVKEDGKSFSSVGGTWESQGYVTAKIREFGDYTIAIDTIPPKIKAVNPESFGKMTGQKYIKLTISDELSGIASYKGMLNGKWILMEYDAKNDLLIYTIDEMRIPGTNTLLVEVRDGKGNKAFYSAKINL